jgi:hypothetical protein
MSSHETEPSGRLHGLDALRGIALLLGVVLHASMTYFPVPIWIVSDTDNSPVASADLLRHPPVPHDDLLPDRRSVRAHDAGPARGSASSRTARSGSPDRWRPSGPRFSPRSSRG